MCIRDSGKLMRAATYFIKEEGKELPVGMLCVNVNISDFEYLTDVYKRQDMMLLFLKRFIKQEEFYHMESQNSVYLNH